MKRRTNNTNKIRKYLVFGLILLLLCSSIVSSTKENIVKKQNIVKKLEPIGGFNSRNNILYVGGNGTNNYTRIQDAIDNASNGDTIFVYNDSSPYYENLKIDISIDLIGEDIHTTVIDGGNHGDVVNVLADGVFVRGFTITNGNNGVRLWYANKNNITYNNLSNNGCGITLMDSSDNIIFGNIISNSGYGIYSYWVSNENIITYNTFLNNDYSLILIDSSNIAMFSNKISNSDNGIYLHSASKILLSGNIISNNIYGIVLCNSNDINIAYNNISNNSYGVYSLCSIFSNTITVNNIQNNKYGIYFNRYSNDNTITLNTISDNNYGVTIAFSGSKNTVYKNNFINNGYGLHIWDSSNNIILDNGESIYILNSSISNTIFHNNFINNTHDAYDECSNSWDNGSISGGNYWYPYLGTQMYVEKDGIYDKPHSIPGGDNQDFNPLVHPFELYYILTINVPSEMGEGTDLIIIVKSLGSTVIPGASVELGDVVKVTDINGKVRLKTPEVKEDTLYSINVTKQGYTSCSEIILVKNLRERKFTIILGKINNPKTEGDFTTFEAVNIRYVTFLPLTLCHNNSMELITTSKYYFGILQPEFIFAITLIYLFPK